LASLFHAVVIISLVTPKDGGKGPYPLGAKRRWLFGGRRRLSFLVCIFLLQLGSILNAGEPKRVLVVHSFGNVAPPFTTHSTAFEAELVERMGEKVDLDEVSLDMARYADPHLQDALVEYLQKRHEKWKPDLVVPIGSPAGIFVAEYRDRLFPDTPILYTGLDRRRLPPDALEKNASLVGEEFDLPGFVEDILQIAPETKNIAIVLGASPLEQYWAAAFRKEFEPFTSRVNFIWLNELSFEQMLGRVKQLPPNSYIFLILLLRDASGVTHNADEALQRLHQVANAPINSIFQHQLGLGIVGGRLYQAELEGTESAGIAVRILHGESPSNFPPKIIAPLPPRYDERELKRWHIDEKLLPHGSLILFRQPTVWQQYRSWILAGASLCLLQALLIFGLLANLAKRRRAERSLAESEKRFQNAADAAPVLIWMSGPDKLCTFFNRTWLEFTGRTMEHELGKGWMAGVHRDDLENCLNTYTKAFDAREPFVMQYRLEHHDGDHRWITDKGVPRYGANGNFRGYVGVCVDITDLLEKQRALDDFEDRVTLAAEAAHLGVWELDTKTNEVWMSDMARKLFQFGPETRINYAMLQERVHREDRSMRDIATQEAIKTGKGYEIEYRTVLSDGNVRWIAGRARCMKDERGELTRLVAVSMDVTERKEAQELFQIATDAAPNGTLLLDAGGRIVLANAHVENLFGYKREELVGKSVEDLIPERFIDGHRNYRTEFTKAPQARAMGAHRELFARRKDGTEFPVEIGLTPVQTPRGQLVLATVTDTSARKLAEEEARRYREQISLLSRLTLLGEMTASLAHELNQPLSAIVSNANAGMRFIDKGQTDPATLREILVDVVADGHRANEIIMNVRRTVKKESVSHQSISLNEMIMKAARMVEANAAMHLCEVELRLADNLPTIEADSTQIQQVLINLLGNAFDAMRDTPVEKRKVELTTERNGDETIRVSVRDHGTGISADTRERLFEQFFTTKEEGLGMGLAIVRSIVESHAGKIDAENVEGGGARFYFTLPTSPATQHDSTPGNGLRDR
jgi:PAS domain S-box-containing protein